MNIIDTVFGYFTPNLEGIQTDILTVISGLTGLVLIYLAFTKIKELLMQEHSDNQDDWSGDNLSSKEDL